MKTLFFFLCLLNAMLATAAQITVEVDRNPVNLKESFQLTYTANDTPDGNPDFEPLTRDFEVLNQSHSSQSSWVNGKSSATIQWIVNLMAKKSGSLVIPGIAFGHDQTEPTTIMVAQQATSPKDINGNAELLLKVEASPLDPYVQSQILYTLRLYRRVNIAQARLDDPKLADAVIQKLGEDSNYNTQVNGIDYVVTERKYAIFPQKSGTVTIAPLSLTADIISDSAGGRFNGFFNQQATRTQKVLSNAITLDVRPAPSTIKMPHWLPAEDVQLQQEWSGDTTKMNVGEPLTRTLRVVAKGATVGLLPELNTPSTDKQLKTYPDQPTLKEMPKPEGIYAFREEKIALIPSSAGTFTLPAIEIPWFNTETQKMQVASLPATTLTVVTAAQASSTPSPTVTATPLAMTPITPAIQAPAQTQALQSNQWFWVSLFLGFGWLTTLVYFLTKRQAVKPAKIADTQPKAPSNGVHLLKQACQSNDAQLAKQALLQWGLAEYAVNSLGELADCCDARLRDEIQRLNQLLYAQQNNADDQTAQWLGKPLLQAFSEQAATQKIQPSTKDDKLEPLYRL